MSQIYYTIEKMVGDMYQPLSAADVGDDSGGEPEFDTEDAAQQQIQSLSKPKAGKGGKADAAPVRAGSYRIVQKLRLKSGIIGAPSAPGALDPPVVPRNLEKLKALRDEQRKLEDEQFERSGYIAPRVPLAEQRREVSGSPYSVSGHDRITSSGDLGAKAGMAARHPSKEGTPPPASASSASKK
jgi:hypothetical protein